MVVPLWFQSDVEVFGVLSQAMRMGAGAGELEGALATAAAASGDSQASAAVGALVSASAWHRTLTRLWIAWTGGAVGVGAGDEWIVMVMTESGAASTLCASDEVALAVGSVVFDDAPAAGKAVATMEGSTIAGWSWQDGLVLRGLPDQGTRVLAETGPGNSVSTIVDDFIALTASAPSS